MSNKSIYILGINPSHNCSAALIKNGKLIAAVSEERFTRRKNQIGLPEKSIEYLLSFADISLNNIHRVIIATHNPHELAKLITRGKLNQDQEMFQQNIRLYGQIFSLPFLLYLRRELYEVIYYKYPQLAQSILKLVSNNPQKSDETIYKTIADQLDVPLEKIIFLDHHTAHIYSSLSNIDPNLEWLLISVDGEGDGICSTIYTYKQNFLNRIAETKQKNSLGLLYGRVTEYLGMKMGEHEYKVMGLAPYAKNDFSNIVRIFEQYLAIDTKSLSFTSSLDMHDIHPYLRRDLYMKRFDDIAGAIQQFTEERLCQLVSSAIAQTNIHNVALSGGVMMNVKANQKISELPEVNQVYFVPSASDESLCWGSAFWGFLNDHPQEPLIPVTDLYLGPQFTDKEIEQSVKKYQPSNLSIKKYNNIEKIAADLLAKGEIIAWFQGRMEWGARALGHRSILGHPGKEKTLPIINSQIKSRDFWMPFTPSILEEDLPRYIINPKNINPDYMILTFNTTPLAQDHLRSAIHPADKTARPQMVRKDWEPRYHKLISEFKKQTDIGAVLNTSMNLHGQPVVCTPEDALFTLLNSGLKYLVMGDYLISKNTN